MVDGVVEVHHNGFNKAIQHYSRILALFTQSTVRALDGRSLPALEDRPRWAGLVCRSARVTPPSESDHSSDSPVVYGTGARSFIRAVPE